MLKIRAITTRIITLADEELSSINQISTCQAIYFSIRQLLKRSDISLEGIQREDKTYEILRGVLTFGTDLYIYTCTLSKFYRALLTSHLQKRELV